MKEPSGLTANRAGGRSAALPPLFLIAYWTALIGIAVFLRVHGAIGYHYHSDEMVDITASSMPVRDILHVWTYEAHPPLGQILRHYWMDISRAAWFVRGLSLLFGVALIALYYAIGREIAGELAGLCAATLIAFGHGTIIQDFTAHNYSLLSCEIGLAFYCYLRWRKNRAGRELAFYTLCGLLAVLTHFSAILPLFCIGGYETIGFMRRRELGKAVPWVLLHCLIAAVMLGMLHMCKTEMVDEMHPSAMLRIYLAALLPVMALGYLLPGSGSVLPGAAWGLVMAALPFVCGADGRVLRRMLGLSACAFLTGMAYALNGYFTSIATGRHNLWLLPFVVPALAWMATDLYLRLESVLQVTHAAQWRAAALTLLLAFCVITYDPHARFLDMCEYGVTERQWQPLKRYLEALGPSDAIIAQRSEAQLLESLYPYLGKNSLLMRSEVVKAPYAGTFLLFDPYYPREYNKSVLPDIAQAALRQGMLDNTQRLVFFATRWSYTHMADWVACAALDKQVIAFPPTDSAAQMHESEAVLLIVSKDVFLRDILSPGGKAHACFKQEPRLIP